MLRQSQRDPCVEESPNDMPGPPTVEQLIRAANDGLATVPPRPTYRDLFNREIEMLRSVGEPTTDDVRRIGTDQLLEAIGKENWVSRARRRLKYKDLDATEIGQQAAMWLIARVR